MHHRCRAHCPRIHMLPAAPLPVVASHLHQFWPHAGEWDALEYGISDVIGGYAQRVLLRFNDLHRMLPDSVNVTGARLGLSFYNWDAKPGAQLMVSQGIGGWGQGATWPLLPRETCVRQGQG